MKKTEGRILSKFLSILNLISISITSVPYNTKEDVCLHISLTVVLKRKLELRHVGVKNNYSMHIWTKETLKEWNKHIEWI